MGALGGIVVLSCFFPVYVLSYNRRLEWRLGVAKFIMVGMLWSFGFVFAAVAWYYLYKITQSNVLLIAVYVAILWLWAALLWAGMIMVNLDQLT